MSMTDPVADYLTRIRNAAQAKHRKVDIPASTLKLEMTKILHEFKYIQPVQNEYTLSPGKRILEFTIDIKSTASGCNDF